ncbi:helix-turn-helix transcriptional regulator [Jeongeupia naejangsanensis]|uniref:AlpA family transcriptional regulator n=1 Tax=Jeongeupia naejangsanensis TaxID=613195 RepID=A0ABS2BQL7_9NEIS|nr:AlpA family transcriptional regulator [Jeongeupia naejangsanensis]MBM3117888.1 AlpA family transcriptional regulator [Jeongeupia naejangsanensis]
MVQAILRRPAVETTTGLSRSAIYDRINPKSPYFDPTFPHPIRLGGNSVGWLESEVQDWISGRIEASRQAA